MISIVPFILTCAHRENKALESLEASDWSSAANVVSDSKYTDNSNSYYRVQDAFRGILEDFLATDYDYLLYLEDDVTVNENLEHNLFNFEMIKKKKVDWLVLCDFGSESDGHLITEEKTTAGAQGLVISRRAAEFALSFEWEAAFDKLIPRELMANGIDVHRYIPSIVQHNKGDSAIGGEPTCLFSPDYDHSFKL